MNDDVSVDELKKAVEHMHGCEASFVEAVEVREEHGGKVVWEGAVKMFDLTSAFRISRGVCSDLA